MHYGGKDRRYWFRRGGTKTSSKEVKRSYFDHRSKESQGHSEQESFHNPKFNQNIEQTSFQFHNFKKRNLLKNLGITPQKCEQQLGKVKPIREIRNGWRTINCAVFVTDERNTLSLCPAEGLTNLITVQIRCVSVLMSILITHPHMYPRSSAPLDV